MRLVFMGTASFAVPSLRALKAAGHDIALVVCQPDRPKGRGHQLQAPELKQEAEKLGLPVFQPEKIKDPAALERLRQAAPEALCVVAYGQILPQALLEIPTRMPLNVHASLLPKFRGAAPIEWAVARGERETGIAVQRMVYKLDAGDVLAEARLPIRDEDDAPSLTPRLAALGAELLVKVLASMAAGGLAPKPQDEALASYAPLLKKADGALDFRLGARELFDRFRAFKARPGVTTAHQGVLLKVGALAPAEGGAGKPAELLEIAPRGLRVGCGDGSVWLEQLQAPGGRMLGGAEWARGSRIAPGSVFEAPRFGAPQEG